jgi:hypothetical protein
MEQSTAARRLVKSPPELWAVLSSEVSLGRHLAEFGEIRITRVDPETTVAWEGDRASGTVELAPAGWGTKVVLTATPIARPQDVPQPVAVAPPAAAVVAQLAAVAPAPQPPRMPRPQAPVAQPVEAAAEPATKPRRRGFFAWLFRRSAPAAAIPPPGPHDPSPPTPAPDPAPPLPAPTPPPAPTPAPDPVPPAPAPDPLPPQIQAPVLDGEITVAILRVVLDDLGRDHHRPRFSRD